MVTGQAIGKRLIRLQASVASRCFPRALPGWSAAHGAMEDAANGPAGELDDVLGCSYVSCRCLKDTYVENVS